MFTVSRSDVSDDSLVIDLTTLIKDLCEQYPSQSKYDVSAARMRIEQESRLLKASLSVHSLNGSMREEKLETTSVEGDILIKKK